MYYIINENAQVKSKVNFNMKPYRLVCLNAPHKEFLIY